VDRGGSIEAQRQLAGKTMETMVEAAGPAQLKMSNYMTLGSELRQAATQKGAGGLLPEEKFVAEAVNEVIEGGGTMTLGEAHRVVKLFGQRAEMAKTKGEAALWRKAKSAIVDDIGSAAGAGAKEAAELLGARKEYAKALGRQDQADFLLRAEDPDSIARNIDPKRLTQAASGEGRAEVEAMFRGDKAGLKSFESLVDSARAFNSRAASSAADNVPGIGAAKKTLALLTTGNNMVKVVKDPAAANMLRMAIDPESRIGPVAAAALIGKVAARIGVDAYLDEGAKTATPRRESLVAQSRP
jgi:hypothetical protein